MKRHFVLFTILLIFLCCPVSLYAQETQENDKNYQKIDNKEGIPLTEMNLSAEQNKSIEEISAGYRNKILQLRSQFMVKQIELKSLLRDSTVGDKKIQAVARENRILDNQIQRMMINYQLEIRKVLTPEQIKAWRTLESPSGKRGWRQ